MDVAQAHKFLSTELLIEEGKFFGNPDKTAIGTGDIATEVKFPVYLTTDSRAHTFQGPVYVLTHECDIHPGNTRPFSDYVLLCPILDFEIWLSEYISHNPSADIKSFLAALAKQKIYRVFYLPCYDLYRFGGLLYFNKITNTHISVFQDPACVVKTCVTKYGLKFVDHMLENHLLRPLERNIP